MKRSRSGQSGLLGIDVHLIEVERDEDVGRRERTAEVPGPGVMDRLHDQLARLDALAPQ